MAEIPEGAQTASGEGNDLVSAIADAAAKLGIEPECVAYKLDMAHFRSAATGNPTAKRTVKIVAWEGNEKKPLPTASASGADRDRGSDRDRGERRERRPRKRDREEAAGAREERGAKRDDRGPREEKKVAPLGEPTEASELAVSWFQTLMELMGVEGTVTGDGTDERVRLVIEAERAGRIIGKRGSTLRAIRHLLGLVLAKDHGDLVIDVDVADDRPRGGGKGRDEGRSRDDDRRGGDRKRGRGRRREGGGDEKGRHSEEKLEALARRAAEKAIETGKTITINLDLNSYDRRIVHVAIAEIDGVESKSEERDGKKYVQVIPAAD